MPESLNILRTSSKLDKYNDLFPQIKSLIEDESNLYANLANVSAALKETFNFFWVGFYLVDEVKTDQLVLGPFQGPIACTRIKKGKGVCGTSWDKNETIIVEDVNKFPGHIACSSISQSEIVVPIFNSQEKSKVVGVLDVDSEQIGTFDKIDNEHLNKLCSLLTKKF